MGKAKYKTHLQSLLPDYKKATIEKYLHLSRHLEGHVAEIGVAHGGTLEFIYNTVKKWDVNLYGFDTFEGMPYWCEKDGKHKVGDFGDVNARKVVEYFSHVPFVFICAGIFPIDFDIDEFPYFSLVHLDVDNYKPTLDSLLALRHMVIELGYIVIDDYGWAHTPGVALAVTEFLKANYDFKIVELLQDQIVLQHQPQSFT